MPKYWGGNDFAHGSFPEVGQQQKTEKKETKKEERLNDGNNNGQATHGAHKHAWRTQAAWAKKKERTMVITMAKLRMAHASHLGQNIRNDKLS